jgi:hypothetical protein
LVEVEVEVEESYYKESAILLKQEVNLRMRCGNGSPE